MFLGCDTLLFVRHAFLFRCLALPRFCRPIILAPRFCRSFLLEPRFWCPFILAPKFCHPFTLAPRLYRPFILAPKFCRPFILAPRFCRSFILAFFAPRFCLPFILAPRLPPVHFGVHSYSFWFWLFWSIIIGHQPTLQYYCKLIVTIYSCWLYVKFILSVNCMLS